MLFSREREKKYKMDVGQGRRRLLQYSLSLSSSSSSLEATESTKKMVLLQPRIYSGKKRKKKHRGGAWDHLERCLAECHLPIVISSS